MSSSSTAHFAGYDALYPSASTALGMPSSTHQHCCRCAVDQGLEASCSERNLSAVAPGCSLQLRSLSCVLVALESG